MQINYYCSTSIACFHLPLLNTWTRDFKPTCIINLVRHWPHWWRIFPSKWHLIWCRFCRTCGTRWHRVLIDMFAQLLITLMTLMILLILMVSLFVHTACCSLNFSQFLFSFDTLMMLMILLILMVSLFVYTACHSLNFSQFLFSFKILLSFK